MIIEDKKFIFDFNKLIIDSKFNNIIDELKSINISLPTVNSDFKQDLNYITFSKNGKLTSVDNEIKPFNLDLKAIINSSGGTRENISVILNEKEVFYL